MIDLEATFEKLEHELREVNQNAEALKKNFLELTGNDLFVKFRKVFYFFLIIIFIFTVITSVEGAVPKNNRFLKAFI
jgi:hypothetical protein